MALGGCARGEIAVQIARRCSLAAIRTGGKVRSQRLWKARGKLGPHRGSLGRGAHSTRSS